MAKVFAIALMSLSGCSRACETPGNVEAESPPVPVPIPIEVGIGNETWVGTGHTQGLDTETYGCVPTQRVVVDADEVQMDVTLGEEFWAGALPGTYEGQERDEMVVPGPSSAFARVERGNVTFTHESATRWTFRISGQASCALDGGPCVHEPVVLEGWIQWGESPLTGCRLASTPLSTEYPLCYEITEPGRCVGEPPVPPVLMCDPVEDACCSSTFGPPPVLTPEHAECVALAHGLPLPVSQAELVAFRDWSQGTWGVHSPQTTPCETPGHIEGVGIRVVVQTGESLGFSRYSLTTTSPCE